MDALIKLAMALEGPDREVERLVAVACLGYKEEIGQKDSLIEPETGHRVFGWPRVTESVDALMPHIPGWAFPHMEYILGKGWVCQMHNSVGFPFKYRGVSEADTPYGFVLAMLIAFLELKEGQS